MYLWKKTPFWGVFVFMDLIYFLFPFSKYPVTKSIPTMMNTNPRSRVRSWYNPITSKMIPKNMCRLSSRLNPLRKPACFLGAGVTVALTTGVAAAVLRGELFTATFFVGFFVVAMCFAIMSKEYWFVYRQYFALCKSIIRYVCLVMQEVVWFLYYFLISLIILMI